MALTVTYGTAAVKMSTEMNSLANSSAATTTAAINNSTDLAPACKLECDITGTAGGTGSLDIYMLESVDGGTDFSTTETANMRYLGSVLLAEAVAVRKIIDVGNLPKHFHLRVINNSGAALAASGSTITYQTVTYTG